MIKKCSTKVYKIILENWFVGALLGDGEKWKHSFDYFEASAKVNTKNFIIIFLSGG